MSTESNADPHSDSPKKGQKHSLFERIKYLLARPEVQDRDDVQEVLTTALEKAILDDESYSMILGSMSFAEKTADDIKVSRSKMDLVDIDKPLNKIIQFVIDTAHSRFPVYQDERDNIIGLLLAKDLLRCINNPNLSIRDLMREAHFVPESKPLNQLLKEFKETHSHLAMVIDEYGSVSGLVTMEDVLEQIVGDIEDEYDEEAEQTIFAESPDSWRVMAHTPIDDFNKALHAHIPEEEQDTLGGWLASQLDHIPRRGDVYVYDHLKFQVLRADERRALWLHVRKLDTNSPTTNSL